MNDQHMNPDEDSDHIPAWKRLWPVLLGIMLALILSGGAYWVGSQGQERQHESAPSPETMAGLELPTLAPDASSASASAAEASGVVFQGAFTPTAALQAIFGETITKGSTSFARWTEVFLPQTADFRPYLGAGPMLVRPLGIFPLQEAAESRQLILFQSVPETRLEGGSPEGAIIGAAVFRPLGNGWQLVRETRAITAAGAYGQAPAGRPVALGPTHLGLLFEGAYDRQGQTTRYAFLVQENEQGFVPGSPVFDMGRDNSGSCSSSSDSAPCHGYSTQLRFGTQVSNGFFLLDLVSRGTRPNSDGGTDSFVELRQYRYQNGRYEEDPNKHVLKTRALQLAGTPEEASSAAASSAE